MKLPTVAVCGLGKAGLPLAAVMADAGITVIGVDPDKERTSLLNKGGNPLTEEPGLGEILKKTAGKTFTAYPTYEHATKHATYFIIIVPLFIDKKTKKPDFSIITEATRSIGKGLKAGDTVILETTVPVGTTDNLLKKTLEEESGLKAGKDFYLAYSPERIMTGYSISRYKEFPKVVGGIDPASTTKAFDCYSLFAKPIKVTDAKTAELVKVAEGVYRDVNIAIANELFQIAEAQGVDFWEMREAARHEFCNIHEPGNVGGHCIPVYPWFLIHHHHVPVIKAARETNDAMAQYYVDKAKRIGGKKAVVIGLSYREGVKEDAYARSVTIISLLKKAGFTVFGLDPLYSEQETKTLFGVEQTKNLEDMDVILLLNKNTEYRDQLTPLKNKVIDVKNILSD